MPQKRIVTGQKTTPEMRIRAQEMRRSMTPAERRLWAQLRAGRLEGFHFRRQQIVHGTIVDFYCHQSDLVVEVDGSIHLEQVEYDHERDQVLEALGLRVLHFTNQQVEQEMDAVLSVILRECQK